MGKRQKQVDALESNAIQLSGGREVQHGVQVDGRLRIGPFSYQTGPHGVVERRIPVTLGC